MKWHYLNPFYWLIRLLVAGIDAAEDERLNVTSDVKSGRDDFWS